METYIAMLMSSSHPRSSRHGFASKQNAWDWIAANRLCNYCKCEVDKNITSVELTPCGAEWDVLSSEEVSS